ncbi:hypothetical protein K1I93_09745, partial [Streptococcus australis]|nr:hypothetical protein [Streptococcus australis]
MNDKRKEKEYLELNTNITINNISKNVPTHIYNEKDTCNIKDTSDDMKNIDNINDTSCVSINKNNNFMEKKKKFINIYYYIKQINKFKNIKQDTQKNLCFNYNIYDNLHINEKEKYKNRLSQNQPFYIINNIQQHQIINIINYHHDVLSSYMYKK